ncbi:rubredoxin-like domain-containing protein [Catenibacterium sp.]|uniref:rubredoxin-like domain-containing protein n=1 Tax=Catenibacterium sp. TaxID=2049022 RepID=UPI003FD6CC7C
MAKFVCKVCGYVYEGDAAPAECPVCHVGADQFEEVKGEMKLAAEHEYGVYAKTVKNNPDITDEDKKFIFDQLKANFEGECSEVHEMARDEARHGKALKGLLDRYFGK